LHGIYDIVRLHVLEQITLRTRAHGAGEVVLVVADRQHQHRSAPALGAHLPQQRQAAMRRHVEVGNDNILLGGFHQLQGFVAIASNAGDMDGAALFQQFGQSLAEQRVIID